MTPERLERCKWWVETCEENPGNSGVAFPATLAGELVAEVERLNTVKQRVLGLIAEKEEEYARLTKDAHVYLDKGWDEEYERVDLELAEVHAQIYVLRSILKEGE